MSSGGRERVREQKKGESRGGREGVNRGKESILHFVIYTNFFTVLTSLSLERLLKSAYYRVYFIETNFICLLLLDFRCFDSLYTANCR